VERVVQLCCDEGLRRQMAGQARRTAMDASWDRVFEGVYDAYREALSCSRNAAAPLLS